MLILFLFFFFFFFFFFHFLSFFYFFFNIKYGETPLFIAAQNGREQIVQILLEKGKPINVDLATEVIFLIFFFELFELAGFKYSFFSFFSHFSNIFFFLKSKGWKNTSFYCC